MSFFKTPLLCIPCHLWSLLTAPFFITYTTGIASGLIVYWHALLHCVLTLWDCWELSQHELIWHELSFTNEEAKTGLQRHQRHIWPSLCKNKPFVINGIYLIHLLFNKNFLKDNFTVQALTVKMMIMSPKCWARQSWLHQFLWINMFLPLQLSSKEFGKSFGSKNDLMLWTITILWTLDSYLNQYSLTIHVKTIGFKIIFLNYPYSDRQLYFPCRFNLWSTPNQQVLQTQDLWKLCRLLPS